MIKRQSYTDLKYSVIIYSYISPFPNKNVSKAELSTHFFKVLSVIKF